MVKFIKSKVLGSNKYYITGAIDGYSVFNVSHGDVFEIRFSFHDAAHLMRCYNTDCVVFAFFVSRIIMDEQTFTQDVP